MHEMKKGLFQDYHRNGEPKTQEEKNRENSLIAGLVGVSFILLMLGTFGFSMWVIFYNGN